MKDERTELVFILDRSGSMAGLETDTIGGYNSLLKKQQEQPGETIVTTVLFDDKYELLHDRIDLKDIAPITNKDYFVRGATALLDAIGLSIQKTKRAQKNTREESRASKVMFVITTDGMENASREYSAGKVRALVEEQKQQGWEFLFLGANIDAVATAGSFGIAAERAANFHADGTGAALNFKVLSSTVASFRRGQILTDEWKQEIDEDYSSRRQD